MCSRRSCYLEVACVADSCYLEVACVADVTQDYAHCIRVRRLQFWHRNSHELVVEFAFDMERQV